MKHSATLFFLLCVLAASAAAQVTSKGLDTQNKQIQDISNSTGSNNSGNRGGVGRGIDWGKGKSPARLQIANPYRLTSKRDILLTSIADVLQERGILIDEKASRLSDGIVVTQPFTFSKGAVVTGSQLLRYANIPDNQTDGAWTRGRYTLTIDVQTIDGINNNISVTAKVEGKTETALGSQWLTLPSSGEAENDFLAALIERITGTSPYEKKQQ
jgi:hypothetical protein